MALPAAEIERVLSRLESELTTLLHACQLTQEERDVLADYKDCAPFDPRASHSPLMRTGNIRAGN